MTTLLRRFLGIATLLLAAIAPAAQADVTVSVSGNTALANISLPGGMGADVTLVFDSVQNLDASTLNISAQLVNVNDPALLSRLPSPAASIPAAFPVLITVEPPAAGGLSFQNAYTLEVHTHNLGYAPGTPLRLFKAPLGGSFEDITSDVLAGSVRARGRGGAFSQFMIVADMRATNDVANAKFSALDYRLNNAVMPADLRSQLNSTLGLARTAYNSADYVAAIARIDDLLSQVQAAAGTSLANVWRAQRDLDNIAGGLLGQGSTLRFTLARLRDFGA
ncbi:DUF6689 family protein [Dokdonella soli]